MENKVLDYLGNVLTEGDEVVFGDQNSRETFSKRIIKSFAMKPERYNRPPELKVEIQTIGNSKSGWTYPERLILIK